MQRRLSGSGRHRVEEEANARRSEHSEDRSDRRSPPGPRRGFFRSVLSGVNWICNNSGNAAFNGRRWLKLDLGALFAIRLTVAPNSLGRSSQSSAVYFGTAGSLVSAPAHGEALRFLPVAKVAVDRSRDDLLCRFLGLVRPRSKRAIHILLSRRSERDGEVAYCVYRPQVSKTHGEKDQERIGVMHFIDDGVPMGVR